MKISRKVQATFFRGLIALLCLSVTATATANPPVKIILDTDFGDDGDDLAALAVLHHLADIGEVELLAVGQSNSRWDAPGAIDVVNTFDTLNGRPPALNLNRSTQPR